MRIKTTLQCNSSPIRLTKIQKLGYRKGHSIYILLAKKAQGLCTDLAIPNKTTCYLSLFTKISFLGIYLEGQPQQYKNTYARDHMLQDYY